jgi:hypothetical protein
MKFPCRISAVRKTKAVEVKEWEQSWWMVAILRHFVSEITFDLEGLKAVGKRLGINEPAGQSVGGLSAPAYSMDSEGRFSLNQSEIVSDAGGTPFTETKTEDEIGGSYDKTGTPTLSPERISLHSANIRSHAT